MYTSTHNLPNLKKGLFLGGQTRHHVKEQDGTAHQFWSLHSIYAYPFDAELPNLTYVVTHMGALFIGGHPGPRRFGATVLLYVGMLELLLCLRLQQLTQKADVTQGNTCGKGRVFWSQPRLPPPLQISKGNSLSWAIKCTGGRKIMQILSVIWKGVRDRPILTMEH